MFEPDIMKDGEMKTFCFWFAYVLQLHHETEP